MPEFITGHVEIEKLEQAKVKSIAETDWQQINVGVLALIHDKLLLAARSHKRLLLQWVLKRHKVGWDLNSPAKMISTGRNYWIENASIQNSSGEININ